MKANEAKKIIKQALEERNLPYDKLTAETMDFTDLARSQCIFVKIHGWKPNPLWAELKQIASYHDFRVIA